jgi:hypothetical protein
MNSRILEIGKREYPQTWVLIDVIDQRPRLLGREIVDLSSAAIELRHVVRQLSRFAEGSENWISVRETSGLAGIDGGHRRNLSFGPRVSYVVERDATNVVHDGRPFRHLALSSSTTITPATSAEIGLYFYGHRPAIFGFTSADTTHGFIGLDWEVMEPPDVEWLLRREMRP